MGIERYIAFHDECAVLYDRRPTGLWNYYRGELIFLFDRIEVSEGAEVIRSCDYF